ncbi:hypothetical protein IWC96_14475 [Brevundimonas sp. BAL450]|uniref:hypothetical protein n=1 Tax=Brevundimonas sp. BAL450 TaxID=1708162 RepID=UPI0018C966B3|nr:hypothetical protein [Brevundimonas sp. BAL450]MBG7616480.1 hypothetical protein [Brevundimonas sp. BAL450]
MKRPVSLSMHRNKVEARRKRVVAADLTRQVGKLVRDCDVRAYAVVAVSSDGGFYTLWDTGGVMPMRAFPHAIQQALSDDIHNSGAEDDWRPSLKTTP